MECGLFKETIESMGSSLPSVVDNSKRRYDDSDEDPLSKSRGGHVEKQNSEVSSGQNNCFTEADKTAMNGQLGCTTG